MYYKYFVIASSYNSHIQMGIDKTVKILKTNQAACKYYGCIFM
jgi:hypothetical protein